MPKVRSWLYWPQPGGPGRKLLASAAALSAVLFVLGAVFVVGTYQQDRARVIDDARREAEVAAFHTDQLLEEHLHSLIAVAFSPAFRAGDDEAIAEHLNAIDPAALGFDGGIAYIDSAGVLRAIALADDLDPQLPVSVADRAYVRAVLDHGEPYIGAATIGRLNPRPILPFAVPVRGEDGAVSGIVVGTMLLERVSRETFELISTPHKLGVAPQTPLVVVDRAGQIIVHDGDVVSPIDVSESPLLEEMRAEDSGVRTGITGLRGMPDRLVGFAQTSTAD